MPETTKKRQKKGDWVVAGGSVGELAHCTRCGEGLRINMPQRIEVVVGASKAFVKAHSNCPPGQYHEKPTITPEEWVLGRDTGTSSLTIWSVITGRPSPHGEYDIPYDPDDFGRCYRLLKLFPAWRKELPRVAEQCVQWKPFVREWDRMVALYEQELPSGRLYNFMKELEKESRGEQLYGDIR